VVQGGTWDQLNAFIEGDAGLRKYRGQIVPRNATRLDWRNRVDFRLAFGIPAGKAKVELTADVENFLNLFDKNNGQVFDEVFPGVAPLNLGGYQSEKPFNEARFTASTLTR